LKTCVTAANLDYFKLKACIYTVTADKKVVIKLAARTACVPKFCKVPKVASKPAKAKTTKNKLLLSVFG
jgi:hypothetical protein